MKKLAVFISSLTVLVLFQNCSDVSFKNSSKSVPPVVLCENPPCDTVNPLNTGSIGFQQPAATAVEKVDILFVTDTSGSINAERAAIAAGLDQFVQNLPANIDYNVAVLLAHGPRSNNSGVLYQDRNEPKVLRSAEMNLEDIQDALRDKIADPDTDNGTDGGEVGMYSLQKLLEADNVADARDEGFFRLDSALAVIFISDENDICAVYPPGITPVVDPDGNEVQVKNGLCVDQNINELTTYQKLLAHQNGLPMTLTGVLYNDAANVPSGGENELGYGYLDLIALNGNTSANLAGNIAAGLGDIGTLVTASLVQRTSFAISNAAISSCAGQVQASSIVAMVNNVTVPHVFDNNLCIINIAPANAGGALATVAIEYNYWTFPQ